MKTSELDRCSGNDRILQLSIPDFSWNSDIANDVESCFTSVCPKLGGNDRDTPYGKEMERKSLA